MSCGSFDLLWLPEPPSNFREVIKELKSADPYALSSARRLASTRLSVNQMHRLGNTLAELESTADEIRLGLLANGTMELVRPAIAASALRYGLTVRIVGVPFNQVAAQALQPKSEINSARCHFVLLGVDHRGLPLTACPGDESCARASVEEALKYVDALRARLREHSGCAVILQTVPQTPESLFGSLERSIPGTLSWLIDQYNGGLRQRVSESSDLLLDAAALAECVGLAQWHDPVQWSLGKFPFAHAAIPLYADWLGRLLGAARGKARKCLVVDLDNTLWGGVVGDDGVAELVLGNGSPEGEAYLSLQQTILTLRSRGVVLAVSSKNDDDMARRAFQQHPEMVLKEEHFSVFQANWLDKAANLRAIAKELNIGVDSLVLLDDNPAERALVRSELPEVAVPELPADPALYARTLLAAGYFESIRYTTEDRQRANQYQLESARKALLGASSNIEQYLLSLAMKAIFAPFDRLGRGRIVQLINKTNQFNLTTRRYSEAQIEAFEHSSTAFTLQVRLVDRFGDNGMIACVICTESDGDWIIDTWLMSCRVLNRRVEEAILHYIVCRARDRKVRGLQGLYYRTDRNGIVSDLYGRLGFSAQSAQADGSRWRLDLTQYVKPSIPIEIITAVVSP